MLPMQWTTENHVELAQAIERQIQHRTWGRIHRLRVEVSEDRVVVQGSTQSYYNKQLALEAVRDVIGDLDRVLLDVEVEARRPHAFQEQIAHAVREARAIG